MTPNKTYVLQVGKKGSERLRILNKVSNPASLFFIKNQLGDLNGKKILDLGCGTGIMSCELAKLVGSSGKVTAIDISSEQIEIAEEYTQCQNINNIEFKTLSAHQISQLTQQFDFIFCRFLLMHVPDVATIIKNATQLLTNNGILMCEESLGFETMFCYPKSTTFERFKQYCCQQGTIHNTTIAIGQELLTLFKKNDLTDIKTDVVSPLLKTAEEKELLWRGAQEIGPSYVKAGIATEQAMQETITELKILKDQDHLISFAGQYLQICGTKKLLK